MGTPLWIIIFIISLLVLLKASDYFIDGAERLGLYFNIKPFVIGVFVLGFGTSLPELVISIISTIKKSSEIVIGNVLGSNITNIFLVLAVAAIIVKKSRIHFDFLEFDLPLFITSSFLIVVTIWDGVFNITDGLFFLLIFTIYIIYTVSNHQKTKRIIPEKLKEIEKEKLKPIPKTSRYNLKTLSLKIYHLAKKGRGVNWLTVAKLVVSPVFICLGAHYIVEAAINLSQILNIGTDIIAASAIALGTSLPELSISFATLKKGKIDEMLGNIIGSNIFNILIVMGIPALISDLIIPQRVITTILPIMLVAVIICFIIIYDKKITRWEGIILLILYISYLGVIFGIF